MSLLDTMPTPAPTIGDRIMRRGWLVAALWLVFLIFPVVTIADQARINSAVKIVSISLIVLFAAIYVHGFQAQHHAVVESREARLDLTEAWPDGRSHFALLVGLVVVVYLLVDLPALGMIPFLISFVAFHFSWPAIWAMNIVGLGATVLLPVLEGGLGEVWFLVVICASVGAATMLVRVLESHQTEQNYLRTSLAISDERSRVARDVHDVLGHSLTAVILKAELCQRLLEDIDPEDEQARERVHTCRAQLAELDAVSRSALAEIRSTVGGLRVRDLADEVMVARTVLTDAGVDLLVTGHPSEVSERHRPLLAWVVREAVTNVVRHAKASRCHIELHPEDRAVMLRVSDDGVGLHNNGAGTGDGNGLRGLRERVESSGGELRIRSEGGTTLEVAI